MNDASTWENRGAHLTLSVGERGWSEFVRASRHQEMALQRSSDPPILIISSAFYGGS